jgi:hypothetical protein
MSGALSGGAGERFRFAEPGLRRALSLSTSAEERAAGEVLLAEIAAKK